MLRNLGEVLEIGFVDPTQYVIDLYTQRKHFLGRKLN